MKTIPQEVLTTLSTVEIEDTNVKITGQLDRKLYLSVNEVLGRIGGKWNKKAKAHVFSEDPTDTLYAVIECGVLEPKVKTGYFPTPPALVARMIELAEIEDSHTILEPSAGQGHISDAICSDVSIFPNNINVCEVLPENIKVLESKGYHNRGDLFEYASLCFLENITFDRILMNPPFEKQADIDHVTTAFTLLREGGILVAIMSSSVMFRENKKITVFRESILNKYGVLVEDNPEGSFKESGTMVNTVMIKLVKR
jgi:phospholipid N-methyltransferase